MQDLPTSLPLWRQLQGAAALLAAVRAGRSLTAALDDVDGPLRPGVQALGFHSLRYWGRAEALRRQLASRPPPPDVDALLCVALACMVPAPGSTPAYTAYTLVDQAVEAAKRDEATRHQASFINGCLRRFLREQNALMAKTDSSPQALWNHPQWWIDRLRKDHPDHWQAILQANNRQASLTLRINTRKTTQAQYLLGLAAINIEASALGEFGVVLRHAQPVTALPGYADGLFSVQDAAAQMAAPLLLGALADSAGATENALEPRAADPTDRPGQPSGLKILDACAAPGGKTAHLLELADADVTALDVDGRRCQRLGENLARLGLQAHVVVADAGQPEAWWDGQAFDGILLDAPCTASGIVRRHPDVRWLRRPSDLLQLAAVQAQLLDKLWPLLRPGGYLLYCTCSVFLAEGSEQVQTFVARHSDALLKPSPGHLLPQSTGPAAVFPDNLPGEHDGFYYALLQKRLA